MALKKSEEKVVLKCNNHPGQSIQLICKETGKLLCIKCVLEPPHHKGKVNFQNFDPEIVKNMAIYL